MDKTEALRVLHDQLQTWRERSWAQLRENIGEPHTFQLTAESGRWYQGEVQVFWDDKPDGAIRVMASIDDGGLRAFVPLTDDFIIGPDGAFVGE